MTCTVVILAGGQGSRLKRLGRLISKASMVVYDQPILARHLDHLLEAGFRRIIVTTNPLHYPALSTIVQAYSLILQQEGIQDADIQVLNNPDHAAGPTEGLLTALRAVATPRCFMVLVDEFIRANSFFGYAVHVGQAGDFGGVGRLEDVRDTRRGGYITMRDDLIVSYEERTGLPNAQGLPSTGNLLFDTQAMIEDCLRFIAHHPAAPSIGDFLEYRVGTLGRRVRAIPEPDFININTQDFLLLANLYAAMERHGDHAPLYTELSRLATRLRETLREQT
jgi:hypothetical protein